MKQTTLARRTTLAALGLVALLAGLAHVLPQPRSGLDYGPAAASLVERGEARLGQASQASLRRVRASMPYFSFAQSLRPRG